MHIYIYVCVTSHMHFAAHVALHMCINAYACANASVYAYACMYVLLSSNAFRACQTYVHTMQRIIRQYLWPPDIQPCYPSKLLNSDIHLDRYL